MINQYLVFKNNETSSNLILQASDLPTDNNIYLLWTPTNGDIDPSHYTRSGEELLYTPPVSPDPATFTANVMADANISTTAKTFLASYKAVIDAYNPSNADFVKLIWAGLKSQFNSSWLDSTTSSLIEGYASDATMPLV